MVLTRRRHARRREAELRAAANQRRTAWVEADAARITAETERDCLARQLQAVRQRLHALARDNPGLARAVYDIADLAAVSSVPADREEKP